jgi:hypothetical protein
MISCPSMASMGQMHMQTTSIWYSAWNIVHYVQCFTFHVYVLVICHDWRAHRLNRICRWMIGLPLVVGLGLAFAGLPFYRLVVLFCHIQSPPFAESWASQIILLFIAMMMICHKVYKQTQASNKWRFRQGYANIISKEETENNSSC